jgi:N,N'-diacetyllegionaminate synthase
MSRTVIIAEAGVNHNGDVDLAKKLIDAAKEAGADYVKFQTWITEELLVEAAPMAKYQKENAGEYRSQFEMLKKLELSFEQFRELKLHAEKTGIKFLSTPDDHKSLDFLADELKLNLLKVGSGEVTNIPFLRRIGNKKKDVILSTGMADLAEVKRAYETLLDAGAKSVALLHCTSNYPAAYASVNLKAMLTMRDIFNTTVGYSDHTIGNEVSIAAVALGAEIIEKHFTIDKKLPGPDHKASIDVYELKELVKQIRNVEDAMTGDGIKKPHGSEVETKKVVSKGIYLNCDVIRGQTIGDEMLVFKRPVAGLSATKYDAVIGKKFNKDIKKGTPLTEADLEIE